MESLDLLNLRADECSFLETALTDVRRYVRTFVVENDQRQVVLVFPPLGARKRFLLHTLVQRFFSELNTISIGSSYGRRTVVYHSSITPMFCETDSEQSNDMQDENYTTSVHRAYRTPSERKAQEKLFQSLMPKKKMEKSTRSTQRKRPDIPIYVPKARRESSNSTVCNNSNTADSPNLICRSIPIINSNTPDNTNSTFSSKRTNGSLLPIKLNNQQKNYEPASLDSYRYVDLSNDMFFNDEDNELKNSIINDSLQNLDTSPLNGCNVLNVESVNFLNTNSTELNESVEMVNSTFVSNCSESDVVETTCENCDNVSITPSLPKCSSDNANIVCIQNCMEVNSSPDSLKSDLNDQVITNDDLEFQNINKLTEINVSNDEIIIEKSLISNNQQRELNSINETVGGSSLMDTELIKECYSNCPNYCLDDSCNSEPLTDVEKNNCNIKINTNTCLFEKLTVEDSLGECVDKSSEIIENCNKTDEKKKKKKKKKVLDVDECSWEDMYDKEDDYIHPLLMKEIVTNMGKVQVKRAEEDYRSHQTIEERSGDGECVIEVYGFSSDLKTIDLMNQFAAFRRKHFEIVWVDDTHALAVFESPNLADQALNTPFALVKTRPLRNAIKESKLKAETVAPLPATRPKTCTALARRLVSSALGLKMNVSPDLLNAERTLLANAKEKKIRETQQRNNIWDNES